MRSTQAQHPVVNGGVAQLRDVDLGLRENDLVEVTKGLKGGDLVAVMGQERLRDGSAISVEVDEAAPSPAARGGPARPKE